MPETVFVDGKFLPRQRARIPVTDHGLLYGDGVFEGIRIYDGCVFRLKEPLTRLYASAKYIALKIPLRVADLEWVVVESVRRNELKDGYIRLVVTRGEGDLGLDPWKCRIASVICIASKIDLYPESAYKKGLDIVTAPTQRTSLAAMDPRVKSCNYLNHLCLLYTSPSPRD